jgi:mRNA interferase HigB
MRLLGQARLEKAVKIHPDAKQWMTRWHENVSAAQWHDLRDVQQLYPATDGVMLRNRHVVIVFNVKGNQYRLLTLMDYPRQEIAFLELLTHAEYSKDRWKQRY